GVCRRAYRRRSSHTRSDRELRRGLGLWGTPGEGEEVAGEEGRRSKEGALLAEGGAV
ncbi:MAG: hypothetical protein AVDCRST_MAG28-1245, partial [uncultured Rubrobacteraceae bacterium]